MRYIGSSETGRCPTPDSAFGAIAMISGSPRDHKWGIPAARNVHAFLSSAIQVMYPDLLVSHKTEEQSPDHSRSRLVLEAVHRVTASLARATRQRGYHGLQQVTH